MFNGNCPSLHCAVSTFQLYVKHMNYKKRKWKCSSLQPAMFADIAATSAWETLLPPVQQHCHTTFIHLYHSSTKCVHWHKNIVHFFYFFLSPLTAPAQCTLTHNDRVHLLTLVFLSHKSALNVNIEQVGLNLFVWFLYFTTCKRLPIKSLYRGNDFDTNLNIIL